MSNLSRVQIAACLLGGLLFCISGCSRPRPVLEETSPSENAPISQNQANTAPVNNDAPVSNNEAVMASASTSTPTPSIPTPTPVPAATPVPEMPIPVPEGGPFSYHTIAEGQTLGYIALLYQTEIEDLVQMNKLDGPSALLQIGQTLRVPVQTQIFAPTRPLLPDSEVVYSPAYVDFDVADFVNRQGGYLATYTEVVDNQTLTGAQLIERASLKFSVGPRVLLALLEYYGGWVTNPTPTEAQLRLPLGPRNTYSHSLHLSLGFTANRINAGYYGYKRDGFWIFHLPDGSQAISAQGSNAGTVGVQNILAIHSDLATWQQALEPDGFMATYRAFFGDPFSYQVQPLIPATLTQPALSLPWKEGQGFYLTSGPHGAFADGSAWAAIDFGPPDVLGNCFYSAEPNTASANGVVVWAEQGEVHLDLDGDGNVQTGWGLLYLHVALDAQNPVQPGQQITQGQVIGYASCEGGLANSSHLHLARRYNGEWMDAGGPVPMNLGGWVAQPNLVPYEGRMVKGTEVRTACECWEADRNLIVNTPSE